MCLLLYVYLIKLSEVCHIKARLNSKALLNLGAAGSVTVCHCMLVVGMLVAGPCATAYRATR